MLAVINTKIKRVGEDPSEDEGFQCMWGALESVTQALTGAEPRRGHQSSGAGVPRGEKAVHLSHGLTLKITI